MNICNIRTRFFIISLSIVECLQMAIVNHKFMNVSSCRNLLSSLASAKNQHNKFIHTKLRNAKHLNSAGAKLENSGTRLCKNSYSVTE